MLHQIVPVTVKVVRQIPSAPYSIFPKISTVKAFLLIQRKQLRNCVPSYFSRRKQKRNPEPLCVCWKVG